MKRLLMYVGPMVLLLGVLVFGSCPDTAVAGWGHRYNAGCYGGWSGYRGCHRRLFRRGHFRHHMGAGCYGVSTSHVVCQPVSTGCCGATSYPSPMMSPVEPSSPPPTPAVPQPSANQDNEGANVPPAPGSAALPNSNTELTSVSS